MKTQAQRIADLEHALEVAMYWLLRAHDSGHREGWESGPSVDETMTAMHSFLCNHDLDPALRNAKRLRAQNSEYYHFELESAVTRIANRATGGAR